MGAWANPRIRCDETQVVGLVAAGQTNEQVAATIGVTVRTLDRWRAARPALNAKINEVRAELRKDALSPCGTSAAYFRGCRCVDCTSANTAEHARRAALARSRPIPDDAVHGRPSTYQWYGCRCAPCTQANTDYNRPYSQAACQRQRAARPA